MGVHSDLNDLKFIFLQPEEVLHGLRMEEFDLAVIAHRKEISFSGFDRYPMPDDEMLVVVNAGSPLVNSEGMITVGKLKESRLFARRDGCSSKQLMCQNLVAQSCDFSDFSSVVVFDDLRFTIQSVLAGDGIAYLSRGLLANCLESGQLIGMRVEGFEHSRGRSVVMLPQKNESELLSELLESIFEVVPPFWRPKLVNSS